MLEVAGFPVISISILLPLLSAIYILIFVRQSNSSNKILYTKYVGILSSVMTLLCTIYLLIQFDHRVLGFQFEEFYTLLPSIGLNYHVGIDGISIFFIFLTALLTLVCIIISLFTINQKIKEYILCFLLMESLLIGAFSSLNLLLFYVYFESTLFPLYLIIGIWGSNNRIYAASKFFLYTFAGSVLLLITIIYIYNVTHTLDIVALTEILPSFNFHTQILLWIGIFVSLAIKIPMVPLHTWLPDAHVEAPTGGSVMLAGILLKLGGYGILRICLPMFPEACLYFSKVIVIMSVVAIIYTSLVAFAQNNMKKVIAYSSISHMGYVTMGIFSLNLYGIQGAIFQMISHGLISAILFIIVGLLYDRTHTKEISMYGGGIQKMPHLATCFLFAVLGSIGLPGTSGFIGELFSLLGVVRIYPILSGIAVLGILLSAVYMLSLYRKVMLGKISESLGSQFSDITTSEKLVLIPLLVLMIIIGVYPNYLMSFLLIPSTQLSNLFLN